jgi:hypothetical protein
MSKRIFLEKENLLRGRSPKTLAKEKQTKKNGRAKEQAIHSLKTKLMKIRIYFWQFIEN